MEVAEPSSVRKWNGFCARRWYGTVATATVAEILPSSWTWKRLPLAAADDERPTKNDGGECSSGTNVRRFND